MGNFNNTLYNPYNQLTYTQVPSIQPQSQAQPQGYSFTQFYNSSLQNIIQEKEPVMLTKEGALVMDNLGSLVKIHKTIKEAESHAEDLCTQTNCTYYVIPLNATTKTKPDRKVIKEFL